MKGRIEIDAVMQAAVQQGIIECSSLEVKTWLSGLFKQLRKLEVATEETLLLGTQQQINSSVEKAPDGDNQKIADVMLTYLVMDSPQGVRDIDSLNGKIAKTLKLDFEKGQLTRDYAKMLE